MDARPMLLSSSYQRVLDWFETFQKSHNIYQTANMALTQYLRK